MNDIRVLINTLTKMLSKEDITLIKGPSAKKIIAEFPRKN